MSVTGAVSILLMAYWAPPEKAKIPPIGKTISRSVRRTDRTGPTFVGRFELKMAASRVMPPSTISSYTTSASLMPYCGCACGVLSILIVSAERRFVTAVGSGRPVNAATRRCGTGVVVVVVDVVVVVSAALALAATPLKSTIAITTRGGRRIGKNYCFTQRC